MYVDNLHHIQRASKSTPSRSTKWQRAKELLTQLRKSIELSLSPCKEVRRQENLINKTLYERK